MKPTDQLRFELDLVQPDYRMAGHMTADQLDCLEERIADIERAARGEGPAEESCVARLPDPGEIRQAEAPASRVRKKK